MDKFSMQKYVAEEILKYTLAPERSPCRYIAPDDKGFYDEPDLDEISVWMEQVLPALAKDTEDVKIWVQENRFLLCCYTYPEIIEVEDGDLVKAFKKMIMEYSRLKETYKGQDT